ncbi:hypothetical protein QYE76_061490 [Lolium multiflorum]|uniref:Uncharacterized protein n=1 Tax=Lolium multiflorum TaxID=4521 RepID=A0AAD8W6D6_LOLMU|nr:hypothetical protein QYE76_061490 [Lolium multiflorum]
MAVKMAVEMAVEMGNSPSRRVPEQRVLSPELDFRDGGGLDGFLQNWSMFLENMFSMKDMHSIARISTEIIPESSTFNEYFEQPHENVTEKDDNEAPIRSKRQRFVNFFGDDFIVYLVDDTPMFIAEAYASLDAEDWKEAIHNKMESILSNGTWELSERPHGCKPVSYRWVFKKKLRPDGPASSSSLQRLLLVTSSSKEELADDASVDEFQSDEVASLSSSSVNGLRCAACARALARALAFFLATAFSSTVSSRANLASESSSSSLPSLPTAPPSFSSSSSFF